MADKDGWGQIKVGEGVEAAFGEEEGTMNRDDVWRK